MALVLEARHGVLEACGIFPKTDLTHFLCTFDAFSVCDWDFYASTFRDLSLKFKISSNFLKSNLILFWTVLPIHCYALRSANEDRLSALH